MEKKLLLLGYLLSHSMHGYQLSQVLQHSPGLPITLTKSNAYRLLGDMESDGWVTYQEEREGNRPSRRVYTVTREGEAAFYRLLRENLSACPTPEFPAAVGFDFVYTLPAKEALALLEQRYQAVRARFQQLDAVSDEILQSHLTIAYLHHYYGSELEWLAGLIDRLRAPDGSGQPGVTAS
jgi:DNA-binding PadR family transcriptional regulator